jgi:hypothetical protein
VRHLIFHITPGETLPQQSCWKWHLRQLNHYAHLFDGQRIFAVVSGPGLLPADEVAPFLPERSRIISLPNHPQLRESYTLPLLLAHAYTVAPQDTVFYAHSQGITWMGREFESTKRWWSLAMYRWLFSQPALDASMQFPVVGWLKFEGRVIHFPPTSLWHYVGVFHWFRAAEVYMRPWWVVPPHRYGAEAYQSMLFKSEQAAAPFRVTPETNFVPGTDLSKIYTHEFWKEFGIPEGPDAESYDGSPVRAHP